MSALPPPLRPWASQLSLFPEELALSLGAHVSRLAAALGSMRPRTETEGGELHGYDGLARRGAPERLLTSEWLLALEAPDEFIRRAAFGEQAFLRPAFRQPQGGRRTVALLDAGPDQLGAPRIAHLALLVVLARRAEAAGALFQWAVLQSPPESGPFSTVDPPALERWLKASSVVPVSGASLTAWREALKLGGAPEDVWLVGSSRLGRLPEAAGLSRIEVEEELAPAVRRLEVQVRPVHQSSRRVALELPEPNVCVRLLRDPFHSATVTPLVDTQDGVQSLRFSADGYRLLMWHSTGMLIAQAVPQTPRASLPRAKRFRPLGNELLVAAGWRRNGGLLAVTMKERTLWVHGTLKGARPGRPTPFRLPEHSSLHLPPPGEPLLLVTTLNGGSRDTVALLDAGGVLHRLSFDATEPPVFPFATDVTALAERDGTLFFVSRHRGTRASDALQLGRWQGLNLNQYSLGFSGEGGAHFGYTTRSGAREAGPLMVSERAHRWRLMLSLQGLETRESGPPFEPMSPDVGERVVGLCTDPWGETRALLVVLRDDGRTFSFAAPPGVTLPPRLSPRASGEVAFAAVSHSLPLLAWLTVNGEVGVWNFQQQAVVYSSVPGGSS
jgi:hypothetical protein